MVAPVSTPCDNIQNCVIHCFVSAMPHFFISYAKKDTRQLALQLSDAFNALPNVTAWVDKSLKAGESWELQIQNEIDRCDYMIVLYSPDINRHKRGEEESYMLSEIYYAKRIARKPIIPVMAQTTEPPMSLVMEQYIDFTLPGLSLNDLITAICDSTGITVGIARITSTEPTAITEKEDGLRATETVHDTSLSLMPRPFAWIGIPGKGYSMSKYPITNAQFARFVEAGGYENREWWTESGWKACREGWHYDREWKPSGQAWTEPRFWRNSKWNEAGYPVVGVSWYECVAFCFWLSHISGEEIMLPTEEQWQYAAQGLDGRMYPWGDLWDNNRCNNNVGSQGINRTTPVDQFEIKGDSPFGVVDMAGNVWEWCLTDHRYKTNNIYSDAVSRVIRGGSWLDSDPEKFRCNSRHGNDPRGWDFDRLGFRICRTN